MEVNTMRLIALLLTDGNIRNNSRSWKLNYSGRSLVLHEIFKTAIINLGKDRFYETIDKKGINITECTSKKLAQYLLSICGNFRTK